MQRSCVWIAADIAQELGISGTEFPSRIMEVKNLLYEVLKDGQPRDIIVLPFFRNYVEVIGHIRDRGIVGPIIIYTQGETLFMNLAELASQGVIFVDTSRFNRPLMIGFLTFMQKTQEVADLPFSSPENGRRIASQATREPAEIRELFRQILRRRVRILVTCQFREDQPTLSVTCEVIQLVGEIETKIVLDKFNPQEFVGLYGQMAKGKPLVGYVSMDEESLGFELPVVHTVMGRITALLPATVYENRRKFFRVEPDVREPVTVYIQAENGPTRSFHVHDVSEGGLGLTIPFTGLVQDAVYPIALALPGPKLILGSVQVMFKEIIKGDMVTYGTTFIMNESDLISVRQYVYKRQAGIISAIRELNL